MVNFKNRTENQKFIHALLKGQTIQIRAKNEDWYDFDINWYLENEDPFGPWNCADEYTWRIKPITTEVTLNVTVSIVKPVKFKFEGVKTDLYSTGEAVYYIHKSANGNSYFKNIIRSVNHDEPCKHPSYITFETEEAMDKAYEQILNAQKGL